MPRTTRHKNLAIVCRGTKSRGATSLVEMMVAITVSAIIGGVAVSFLVSLQRWDERLRNHGVRADQLLRLAESIRSDLRRATEVSVAAPTKLLLELDENQRIVYELAENGCHRLVQSKTTERPAADLFAIGQVNSQWELEKDFTGNYPLCLVSLPRRGVVENGYTYAIPLVVYAALGAESASTNEDAE